MEIEFFDLPTFWAAALANDDRTGLSDADERALDAFFADNPGLHCVDSSDETAFMRWHDAATYGVLACECCTYLFHKTP
jgi:hypothetical protein